MFHQTKRIKIEFEFMSLRYSLLLLRFTHNSLLFAYLNKTRPDAHTYIYSIKFCSIFIWHFLYVHCVLSYSLEHTHIYHPWPPYILILTLTCYLLRYNQIVFWKPDNIVMERLFRLQVF